MLVFAYAQRINSRRDVLLSSGKNILGDHPFHFFLLARTHLTDLGNSFFFLCCNLLEITPFLWHGR